MSRNSVQPGLHGSDRQSLPRRDQLQSVGAATFALPVRTTLSGSWDAQVTVLLDNQRLGERVGVLVFTRFVPDNGATPLLVNRGWVALDARPALPDLPTPSEGAVRFSGLLVPPPAAGLKLGSDQWQLAEKPPLLTWLDIGTLAGQVGPLFDGVLQLDADAADGFVRRWQALPNTLPPEKHRGYAVQWFGFALATVVFYFILAFPRRP